jgi:hypothetical protein
MVATKRRRASVSVKRKDDSKYFEPTRDSRAVSEDFIGKKKRNGNILSKREKHMLILVSSIMYFFLSARPGRRPVYLCFLKRSRHSMRETTAGNYNI